MTKFASLLTLLATMFVCLLSAAPAFAQRDRVFVASYGSDSNPCTFGSPCKTFQNAVSVVAAGGEVTAIDSAGFGPVSITQSVTITSPNGVEAGIAAASGGSAIGINAPGATVVLRSLTLEGANAANYGIYVQAASRVEIIDCFVGDFHAAGTYVNASAATSVAISNTIIADVNGGGATTGIFLFTTGGGTITATLDYVTIMNDNIGFETEIAGSGGSIQAIITNSHIDNNYSTGLIIGGVSASAVSNVVLKNVTLIDDAFGVSGESIELDSYASVWLSQVTQTAEPGSSNGAITFFGSPLGIAYSDGSNHLMGAINGGSLTSWASN
jgi:hypothetical protein